MRLFSVFLALAALLSAAQKQPIIETDLLKISRVTQVEVTPDGAFAIYGVLSIHTEPAATPKTDPTYSYRTNLWLADLRDPSVKPVQLTFGERSDTDFAISPDGSKLAFVRPDEKKKPQIYLLYLHAPGEAQALTTLEFGATHPRWRADSKALIALSPIPISKLPGKPEFSEERPSLDWAHSTDPKATGSPDGDLQSIRTWLDHNAAHSDPVDLTRMAFLAETSLQSELSLSQVFEISLDATPTVTQRTKTFREHTAAIFAPKGDQILFSAGPDPKRHPDRALGQSAIYTMNADGSNEHVLINAPGYSSGAPHFAHDGRIVFLAHQTTNPPTANPNSPLPTPTAQTLNGLPKMAIHRWSISQSRPTIPFITQPTSKAVSHCSEPT